MVDWFLFAVVGSAVGWAVATTTYRSERLQAEQSMCNTAFLLTRKSSDTVALVARQHVCVRQLSAKNTNDPFPFDTLNDGFATKPVPNN